MTPSDMNSSETRLDLSDSCQSGVYFIGDHELGQIADAAVAESLSVTRIDLGECLGKKDLLAAIAGALRFPASFGGNWDALADSLKDLGWLPESGHVLLFEGSDAYADLQADEFDTLLDILDEAGAFAAGAKRPLFTFFALPDATFETDNASSGK